MSEGSVKRKVGRPTINKTGLYRTEIWLPKEWVPVKNNLHISWRHLIEAGLIHTQNKLKLLEDLNASETKSVQK